jgi:orotate phosphoribosyltransferase
MKSDRDIAMDIIRKKSMKFGMVKLSSGEISSHYFDMKQTMLDPIAAPILARMLLKYIRDMKAEFVGGLELGAVPIISSVVMLSGLDMVNPLSESGMINGLIIRKVVKPHGMQKLIEGIANNEVIFEKNVVIVEDVTTTGLSAKQAVDICRGAGANVVGVATLVDRQEGASAENFGCDFHALFTANQLI